MRHLALLTVLTALAAVAPASGLTLASDVPVSAVAFRGDDVVAAYPQDIRVLRGSSARPIIEPVPCPLVDMAASAAALITKVDCKGDGVLYAGTGGDLPQLAEDGSLAGGIAASGSRVAYLSAREQLTVHDLAGIAPDVVVPVEAPNVSSIRMRLAGEYLAYAAGTVGATVALRVVDLTTGAVTATYDSDVVDFDVAADGAVALLRRDRAEPCGARLLVALPGQQAPTGVVDCARPLGVRIAQDRAAFVGRDGLELFDLASGARTERQVIPSTIAATGPSTLAFDGARIAYAVTSCGGRSDIVLDVLAGATPAPLGKRCPLSLPPQSPRVHGTHVIVRARCPQGCFGLEVTLRQDGHVRHASDVLGLGAGEAQITRVHPGSARVTVSTYDRTGFSRQSATRTLRLR